MCGGGKEVGGEGGYFMCSLFMGGSNGDHSTFYTYTKSLTLLLFVDAKEM